MNNNTTSPNKDLRSPDHFSYLLRLWRTDGQWRASLEIPETRDRVGFANLEQLFAYLMNLVESNEDTPDGSKKKGVDDSQKPNENCGCASTSSQ